MHSGRNHEVDDHPRTGTLMNGADPDLAVMREFNLGLAESTPGTKCHGFITAPRTGR